MKRSRLLSALGFHHMQSAPDRDDFVKINFENINSNYSQNFRKYNSSYVRSFNISYDYESIMHYASDAFSKDDTLETIEPLVENDVALGILYMGQRERMTEKDVSKLNLVYKCAASDASAAQPISIRSNIYCFFIFINYYSYYYYYYC